MTAVLGGLIALLIVTTPIAGFAQGNIDNVVIKSVVQLVTPNSNGTGFLITVPASEVTGRFPLIFLITNKHMIGTYNPTDKVNNVAPLADWIGLRFYTGTVPPIEEIRVELKGPDGKLDLSRSALDPDPLVDVAVIRVDDTLVRQNKQINVSALPTSYLEPFGNLPGSFGNIGAMVYALGYPRGITSLLTNYPVAKVGHLAAPGGEELAIRTRQETTANKIVPETYRGKLLLIDGLLVPGNAAARLFFPAPVQSASIRKPV